MGEPAGTASGKLSPPVGWMVRQIAQKPLPDLSVRMKLIRTSEKNIVNGMTC